MKKEDRKYLYNENQILNAFDFSISRQKKTIGSKALTSSPKSLSNSSATSASSS